MRMIKLELSLSRDCLQQVIAQEGGASSGLAVPSPLSKTTLLGEASLGLGEEERHRADGGASRAPLRAPRKEQSTLWGGAIL